MNTTKMWTIFVFIQRYWHQNHGNRIGGVMVSVLASSAVDRGFVPRSGQITKTMKSLFSASLLTKQH